MFYRFVCLCLLIALQGCANSGPWVELKGQKVFVEVESDPAFQALGMMFREELAGDHGMLFVYRRPAMLSFWMKNTRIPLDILYFDGDLKLVTLIDSAQPCRSSQCPSYPSTYPAQYVLEINAGKAREWGVELGDRLELNLD